MSKEQCVNKKLHPYCKTGIYGWIGEEVDDNDYIICPICGDVLGMNYWDYSAENNGDNKCPKCKQELDYSEIYDFEDTCYFDQLVEIKNQHIADLEAKLAECKEEIEVIDEDRQFKAEMWTRFANKCKELKQQLAEKEKELKAKETLNKIFKDNREAKISFAVEQLEKVKGYFGELSLYEMYDKIDNQINVLRNNKDGIH